MLSLVKMNHAHPESSREGETSVFGYDFANAYAPPTPPALSSNSRGIPLLTNAEFDNNSQFLDFFMNNTAGPSNMFDSFDHTQTDSLPNFQGMSSTFGRPDSISYDSSMFTNPSLDATRAFDTTFFSNRNMMPEPSRPIISSPADVQQRLFPNGLETTLMHQRPIQARSRPSQTDTTTLGFGSDAAFANRRYVAPPGQDERAVAGELLAVVKSFELTQTAPDSHPSSPTTKKKRNIKTTQEAKVAPLPQARKRRQSEVEETQSGGSSEDEDDMSNAAKSGKSDKPNGSSYRRKSKGKASEPKRQNLTEREKRENHIRSEQKRRNQIKEGFASLLKMVPPSVAEGSGNSKCIILSRSVDWLNGLKDGNEKLKAQLAQLGGSI